MSEYLRHTDPPCAACERHRSTRMRLWRLALAILPGGLLVLGVWWAVDKYRKDHYR